MNTVQEVLDKEFTCEHPETEIRYQEDSLGRRQYFRQCLKCGRFTTSALPHKDMHPHNVYFPPVDLSLQVAWWKRRQIRSRELTAELRNERQQEWQRDYEEHLQSAEWQTKREMVFERDRQMCQARLPGCRGRATEVHHKSYAHLGNEPLWDLESVCSNCHRALHPNRNDD